MVYESMGDINVAYVGAFPMYTSIGRLKWDLNRASLFILKFSLVDRNGHMSYQFFLKCNQTFSVSPFCIPHWSKNMTYVYCVFVIYERFWQWPITLFLMERNVCSTEGTVHVYGAVRSNSNPLSASLCVNWVFFQLYLFIF